MGDENTNITNHGFNSAEINIFTMLDKIGIATCVSTLDTSDIVYLNPSAKKLLNNGSTDGRKSYEIFSSEDSFINAYLAVDINNSRLWVPEKISFGGVTVFSMAILHAGCCLRLDALDAPPQISELLSYPFFTEIAFNSMTFFCLDSDHPEANINAQMRHLLYLYNAMVVFVLEYDDALQAIYRSFEQCCDGEYDEIKTLDLGQDPVFSDHSYDNNEQAAGIDNDIIWLYHNLVKNGRPIIISTASLQADYPEQYNRFRRSSINTIMVGTTHNGSAKPQMYLVVVNPQRFLAMNAFFRVCINAIRVEREYLQLLHGIEAAKQVSPQIKKDEVVMRIFGGFEIQTQIGVINENLINSQQCSLLLLYLLCNRNRIVSVRELAEKVWPEQLIDNPGNLLKNVVFRTRRMLESICDKPLIIAQSGNYIINPVLDISTDYERFGSLCQQARSNANTSLQKINLYRNALEVYRGDITLNCESNSWIAAMSSYYQLLFAQAVGEYLQILDAMGEYLEMFRIASSVINLVYNDNDIQYMLIDSLIKQKKYDMARRHYQQVEKILSKDQRKQILNYLKDS